MPTPIETIRANFPDPPKEIFWCSGCGKDQQMNQLAADFSHGYGKRRLCTSCYDGMTPFERAVLFTLGSIEQSLVGAE